MYVDESGDPGLPDLSKPGDKQPSRHYILTGFVISAKDWRNYLNNMVAIRRYIKNNYGLLNRVELHGTKIISPHGQDDYHRIGSKRNRVALYREVLKLIVSNLPASVIINVHLDKHKPAHLSSLSGDIQYKAWERLIQRYNTYLQRSCAGELGLIFADQTNEIELRRLVRKMRVFNPVPSHFGGSYSATVDNIVEDPVMRNSENSYFIQIADLICHALYRKLYPKGSYKRFGIDKLFDIVGPLCLKAASSNDPYNVGIVHL
ncbi:MAG: DUF3800 domain-containing protein [bacterium]|nr:DUF3800 domain-containing protein [bacterium]